MTSLKIYYILKIRYVLILQKWVYSIQWIYTTKIALEKVSKMKFAVSNLLYLT